VRYSFLPFLLVALLASACSKNPAPIEAPAAADVLMELKPNNRWTGRRTGNGSGQQDTLTIVSDMTTGGEKWYLTDSNERDARPDMVYGPWMQNRGDGLYTTFNANDSRSPVERRVKFPVALGDTAIVGDWFQVTYEDGSLGPRFRELGVVTALKERLSVHAGLFDAFKVGFRLQVDPADSTVASAESSYDAAWFAPRVGLLRAERYDAQGAVSASWELTSVTLY